MKKALKYSIHTHSPLSNTRSSPPPSMLKSPGIIVSTLPKSGTMYINARLQDILKERYQLVMAKAGRWPNISVHEPSIRNLIAQGNQFTVGHIPATPVNLADLELFGLKHIAIHIRDPRQAILSWTHWIDRSKSERSLLPHEFPSQPNYFDRPFQERLDWQIDNQLHHFSSFLDAWIQAASQKECPIKIKLTKFSEMKNNPADFFADILKFFGVTNFHIPENIKNGHSKAEHFRKGLENEWETVFSPEQQKRASSIISPQLNQILEDHS